MTDHIEHGLTMVSDHIPDAKQMVPDHIANASKMAPTPCLFYRLYTAVTAEEYSLIKTGGIIFYRSPETGFIEAGSIDELMAAIEAAKERTK